MTTAARLRLLAACAVTLCLAGLSARAGTVTQTNLISDGSVPALHTDSTLINPWGISTAPGGPFWISDNGTGISPIYDSTGDFFFSVTVPPPTGQSGLSAPTGQVYNPTNGFVLGTHGPALFLFATEDGTISGWNGGLSDAVLAVDRSEQHAIYKGLAIAQEGTRTYLLAANFHSGMVEVYNESFRLIREIRSPGLPGYISPFNVAVLDGHVYIAYAHSNVHRQNDVPGGGHGYLDEVKLDGRFVRRIQAHGPLNSPWGMAIAPSSFGTFAGALLVGNFGNGHINAFDVKTGSLLGTLMATRHAPVAIDGLWALQVGNGGSGGDATKLYFTAGPNHEADGLFGSLTYVASPGE